MSAASSSAPTGAAVRHVLTILAVERLAESVAFYRAAFDWQLVVETPVYVELLLPGGQRLGLYQREGFARNTGQAPMLTPRGELAPCELYFFADDLPAALAKMRAAGARVLSPLSPRPWGDEAAYYADPDGNVLVLARPAGA